MRRIARRTSGSHTSSTAAATARAAVTTATTAAPTAVATAATAAASNQRRRGAARTRSCAARDVRGLHTIAICAASLALGAAPAAAGPLPGPDNPWLERRPLNIAHQGGEVEAPSDTLYASRRGCEQGADVLEMDVHLTADGEVVALHDRPSTARTNGTGSVEEMTLAQIKRSTPPTGSCPARHDARRAAPRRLHPRGIATGEQAAQGLQGQRLHDPDARARCSRPSPTSLINIELKPPRPRPAAWSTEVARPASSKYSRDRRRDRRLVPRPLARAVQGARAGGPHRIATGQAALLLGQLTGPAPGRRTRATSRCRCRCLAASR